MTLLMQATDYHILIFFPRNWGFAHHSANAKKEKRIAIIFFNEFVICDCHTGMVKGANLEN